MEQKSFNFNSISAGTTKTICSITANSNQELLIPIIDIVSMTSNREIQSNEKRPIINLKFECEDGIKEFKIINIMVSNTFYISSIVAEEFIPYLQSEGHNKSFNDFYFYMDINQRNDYYDVAYFTVQIQANNTLRFAPINKIIGVVNGSGSNQCHGIFLESMRKIKKFSFEIINESTASITGSLYIKFMVKNK